ncbi:2-amino-4-hydroxy-6-hydroxymethyldihydropteridine diphosphokinase [Rhizobium sp. FKY42]|uniref:2-amino-4-hydroxy-6- hydroxymethyldihydropteridine diphosphokinase n=1 Tax=Rhizobium sp. FKY42 TaxID=2562310 RepID=UPI0010C1164E|nr:2-amino-4-hydroxy-6-hydroxymethyldihydropteridine diphosphokinase [Rhizobium sp. FKY42]
MVQASIGLGGNLGDPIKAMAEALNAFQQHPDCSLISVSRLYRTPPWGKTDQADFFNSCAVLRTSLEPLALLDLCLSIERSMKRVRIERWGPRTIDIDVLTYGDAVIDVEGLEVPHPRMTQRAFVLMPLADLLPHQMVSGKPVSAWLDQADKTGIEIESQDGNWWLNQR